MLLTAVLYRLNVFRFYKIWHSRITRMRVCVLTMAIVLTPKTESPAGAPAHTATSCHTRTERPAFRPVATYLRLGTRAGRGMLQKRLMKWRPTRPVDYAKLKVHVFPHVGTTTFPNVYFRWANRTPWRSFWRRRVIAWKETRRHIRQAGQRHTAVNCDTILASNGRHHEQRLKADIRYGRIDVQVLNESTSFYKYFPQLI
jgi:hypothetical protein